MNGSDIQKITDALLDRLDEILLPLHSDRKPPLENREQTRENQSTLSVVLNSKFIVTTVGGLILAIATQLWQSAELKSRESLERQRIAYQEQRSLVSDFATGFPRSINLLQRFRDRAIWIGTPAEDRAQAKYMGAQSYASTLDRHDQLLDAYLSNATAEALVIQVRATFTDPDVQRIAGELAASIDLAITAKTKTDLWEAYATCDEQYEELLEAMEKAVHRLRTLEDGRELS